VHTEKNCVQLDCLMHRVILSVVGIFSVYRVKYFVVGLFSE